MNQKQPKIINTQSSKELQMLEWASNLGFVGLEFERLDEDVITGLKADQADIFIDRKRTIIAMIYHNDPTPGSFSPLYKVSVTLVGSEKPNCFWLSADEFWTERYEMAIDNAKWKATLIYWLVSPSA